MAKKSIHPFIQAMYQRRALMNRLLLGLDPAYKIALTNIDDPKLADAIINTPRLQPLLLKRFAQVFELPEQADVPPMIAELLQESPYLWPELMKAAGLLQHFRRLPPVLLKDEMEYLAQLFGKRMVGIIFQNRNFAPHWNSEMRMSVEDIILQELYEDGARSLRLWAKERMGNMIGWFTPILPPAIGEDINPEFMPSFDNAIQHAKAETAQNEHEGANLHHLNSEALKLTPENIQQRIATIDLLLPLIRALAKEGTSNEHLYNEDERAA